MDDQVQYSTVDIRLSEVKTLTPETPVGFAEEAGRAFLDGWEAFSLFIKGLVLGLIYAWPAVLIVVIVVIVVVRTHPARQARRAARLAQRTAPPAAAQARRPPARRTPRSPRRRKIRPNPNTEPDFMPLPRAGGGFFVRFLLFLRVDG